MINSELGRIAVDTIPLPKDVRDATATYTATGKVFLLYRTEADPAGRDWYHAAVLEDDGSAFRPIFSGPIPQHPKANGVRHMMFRDNLRVLLGDHVLECSPDLDTGTDATLVPVDYPWDLKSNTLVSHHWSEVIVAPDDEHVAWTILRTDMGADAAIGRLRRAEDRYVVEDAQLISTPEDLVPDPDRAGYLVPQPMRGGEVKQFVRGGRAISIVGAVDGLLPDSVVQDLDGEGLTQVTRTPGYDETTIFSPDERLGIVMSSRFSGGTDPAALGLLPRPHAALTGMGLAWAVYTYTVTGVRSWRSGNVGPVLVDIARSRHESGYQGVPLNSPDESWVYISPMSWHPDGRRVLWPEMRRGSDRPGQLRRVRLRRAELLDHRPQPAVPVQATPARIPYALTGLEAEHAVRRAPGAAVSGRIAGRHSGYLEYDRRTITGATGQAVTITSRYVDLSDDGRTFYSGYEQVQTSFVEDTVYEADLELTGEDSGEMRLRATWSSLAGPAPATLRFDRAADGQPMSHGFARYGDRTLRIEDLVE